MPLNKAGKIFVFCLAIIIVLFFSYQQFRRHPVDPVFAQNNLTECISPEGIIMAINNDGNCPIGTILNFTFNQNNYPDFEALLDLFDEASGFGDISAFLAQFNSLGGNVSDLLGDELGNIGQLTNTLPLNNLSPATEFLNILTDAGFDIRDVLGNNIGFGDSVRLFQSIGNFSGSPGGLEDLNNILNEALLADGGLDPRQIILSLGGGSLNGLVKTNNEPTAFPSDDDDSSPPATTNGPISERQQADNQALQADEDQLQKDQDLDKQLEECSLDDFKDLTELDFLGNYVPVREVEGTLMNLTRDTNELTGNIKDLSVQICLHTKAIKRIQQKFEKLEFVDRPDARRRAATAIEEYKDALFKFINEGYEGDSPELFVTNWGEYEAESRTEAANRILDQLRQSDNYYKDDILSDIEKNQKLTLKDELSCSIAKEDLDKLYDPNDTTLTPQKKAEMVAVMFAEPACNIDGAYLITLKTIHTEQIREQQRRDIQLIASGGYKPYRECVQEDDQGNCIEYKNKLPANIIGNSVNAALASRLYRFVNPEPVDVREGYGPELEEIRTLSVVGPSNTSAGGGRGGGGGLNGFNLNSFINDYNEFLSRTEETESNHINNEIINSYNNLPPVIFAFYKTPTEKELNDDPDLINYARLAWFSPNAQSCKTGNIWLGGDDWENENFVRVIRENNANLPKEKLREVFSYPLAFDVKLIRDRNNDSPVDLPAITDIPKNLAQTTVIRIPNDQIESGDALILSIRTEDGNFLDLRTAVPENFTINTVVNAIKRTIETRGGNEMKKYTINYAIDSNEGRISISAEPKYTIICENDNGSRKKTIIIERN